MSNHSALLSRPLPVRGAVSTTSRPRSKTTSIRHFRQQNVVAQAAALSTETVAPAGFSAEQLAFLERKKAETGASYSAPSTAPPTPSASASAGGFSAEQLAFMERKKAESGGSSYSAPAAAPAASAPAPAGGFSAEQLAFMERKKAETGGASYSAPAATPAASAPAPAGGFSAEQLAFMERKKAESGGASFSAPAPVASSPAAGGYSAEQLAFLERKKAETGATYTAAPTSAQAPSQAAAPPVSGSASTQFIRASLDYFALHQLAPKGRRKNVDVGDPYDFAGALIKGKCGSWACSEGGWDSPSARPTTEVFYVFSGEGCVSDPDGTRHPFGPGDVVVLPRGWYGRWDITRKIHKVWVIHDHEDIPGASVTPVVVPFQQLATDAAVGGLNLRMDAVNGMPVTTSSKMYDVGDASVGFWSCSAGTFPCTKKATEYFHVIEGDFDLVNADGTAEHCVAGDTVVLPKGWTGHWDVFEKVRKVWVTIQD